MGYPEGHKAKTRERIVLAARKLWKTKGYGGASVDHVMKEAGLTRGGFYAHFKSKDALFAEALADHRLIEGLKKLEAKGITDRKEQQRYVIDWYLDHPHRDHPEDGCVLTTLSQEVSRLGNEPRGVLNIMVSRFGRWLSGEKEDKNGLAALSMMVGAVTLARAVGEDEELSSEILNQAKQELQKVI
ncbi:TetR/AcrR family transcriptional regulator [Terasakiella sp. A23]|uniref:TetR/AcrR family transcriptional regulator n=1 Tax=Terasakiella sp. FCG-A23 TaxID=3080561 RepID=UPI00295381EA|nr:TetR/AcrR family transcriptional regulator [Terasakiella sp. A23]MDV7339217.1 TetR/AcrR family transcriptional regulator [Terasakiella sp. A23]